MAKETNLGVVFIGTDFQLVFEIRNEAETASINITGWALSFRLKRRLTDADAAALITKTTGAGDVTIAGTFNSDPAVNAQRATVTLLDSDTDPLAAGATHFELKRTDDGNETVLSYGVLPLTRGVHRT